MPEEGRGSSVFRRRAAAEWTPVLVDQILSLSGPSESKQARKGPDGGREHVRNAGMGRGLCHGDFLDFGPSLGAGATRESGATVANGGNWGRGETHALSRLYNATKPLKCQVEMSGRDINHNSCVNYHLRLSPFFLKSVSVKGSPDMIRPREPVDVGACVASRRPVCAVT